MGDLEERVFHKLGDLIPDIRLMIWELALPGPQVVGLCEQKLKNGGSDGYPMQWSSNNGDHYGYRQYHKYNCKRSPSWGLKPYKQSLPPMLFVCKESHAVASKCYPAFCFRGGIAQTYFDFKHDTLYLQWADYDNVDAMNCMLSWMEDREGSGNLRRVQNLAIEPDAYSTYGELERGLAQTLHLFGGVKKVTLVAEKHWVPGIHGDDSIKASFIDPINLKGTLAMYEKYVHTSAEDDEIPILARVTFPRSQIDYDLFLRARSQCGSPGVEGFPIPEIEFKVAVFEKAEGKE